VKSTRRDGSAISNV
jgi:transcriptional adapter 2-alpha